MDETKPALEGGCGCGAVRYRLIDCPIFVNNCHCRLCQRQTGTGSAVNAFIESDRIDLLSGNLTEHALRTGSDGVQIILRCAECGTPMWSHYPRLGPIGAAVRVGTLDDPSAVRPDAAIFVDERPAWAPLPEGVPTFQTGYNPAELLPPLRLARLKALLPA
ncbi:GFA family protein [Sphingosinicella sp. BN140058]|uniref:GFA family protein n=1 Tax=Sphingosinicella sp. BN140058 TaxID=1892855 RepID=UPI00101349FF|nr:GFA family protein [Sphingosinicella sp. BN140058]QAY75301.1 GFA family protein [Sphingosinicella sp. BN140058]